MLLKRGLQSRANITMFYTTLFMFLLSTAYWAYSVAYAVDNIQMIGVVELSGTFHDRVTKYSPLFNALVLINYILTDGVVVWRAWLLCIPERRKFMVIPVVFLALTTVSISTTIVFKIFALVKYPVTDAPAGSALLRGINIVQIANLGMSLLSNISATSIIGSTAWKHRQTIRAAFKEADEILVNGRTTTKADQILALIVESGLLYCVSGATVLVSSLIRLPFGTLGDLYTPVNIQFAGAYPTIVLLLVSLQRSLSGTTQFSSVPSQPMEFERSPHISPPVISMNDLHSRISIHFPADHGVSIDGTSHQSDTNPRSKTIPEPF